MSCEHPQSARRIERVRYPEGTYRMPVCSHCGHEFEEQFIPSKLTRAVMDVTGAASPDDFGIAFRNKKGWSPAGFAMALADRLGGKVR